MASIANQSACRNTNFFEVDLRIGWVSNAVSLAGRTNRQRSSSAQTTTRMTSSAFFGVSVGVETVRTHCEATAVGVVEKEVETAGGCIETFFGSVLACSALRATLLTQVKDVGVDELTSWTGGSTCVRSDVFVVSCVCCGGCGISIHCHGCDVLTALAISQPRVCAS